MYNNDECMAQTWHLDTGTSHHLTSNRVILANMVSYIGSEAIMLGIESIMPIASFGNNTLNFGNQDLTLCNVLFVS